MFEKMVESTDDPAGSRRRRPLLASASMIVLAGVSAALLFSLFNQTLAVASEFGEIDRLISPPRIAVPDRKEQMAGSDRTAVERKAAETVPIRTAHVQRIDEPSPILPPSISTIPSGLVSRPLEPYKIGTRNSDPGISRGGNASGEGFGVTNGAEDGGRSSGNEVREPTVAEPPKIAPEQEKPEWVGVVNGTAIDLKKPDYPKIARDMGVKGVVKVQVLIDEEGNVASANALEGPAVLRSVSVAAALSSKFTPTTINRRNVKVRGIIIYNFK